MRHGKRFNHLGRTSSHRKATLANMASSLIIHKRLTTTVAKAKALRKYVEPLITRSKVDSTHSRRVVFSYLRDKDSSHVLFNEVAERVAERPGGYTRIIKLGNRLGDNAEMCMIELVDFNETYKQEEKQTRGKTRRSRRGSKKKSSDSTQAAASTAATEEANTAVEATAAEESQSTEEAVAATATEESSVQEESAADSETQEEVVELSGEAVVGDSKEAEVAPQEASADTEEQAASDDESTAKDDSSADEDEEKPKE